MMRQTDGQTAESEQMQRGDQGEGINVQGRAEPILRTVVCWWGHGCRFVDVRRHHNLISWMRERASSERSDYPLFHRCHIPSPQEKTDRIALPKIGFPFQTTTFPHRH